MSLNIRPFTPDDYQWISEISALVFEDSDSAETHRQQDEKIPADIKRGRFIAEWDGQRAGMTEYIQFRGAFHPQRFDVGIVVHPDFRRRGIGSALYEHLMAEMAPLNPIQLTTGLRENWPEARSFALKREFPEVMRTWENHLDLKQADLSKYDDLLAATTAMGYVIRPATDVEQEADFWPKIHALAMELRRDIPSAVPLTDIPMEEYRKLQDTPHRYPQAYMIAMQGDEWVGISALWKTDQPGLLQTGMTAVKREHRGAGLSKALKVRSLRQGQADGYAKVKTWNESNNVRMLAVNEWLGFQRQPAWVTHQWNKAE